VTLETEKNKLLALEETNRQLRALVAANTARIKKLRWTVAEVETTLAAAGAILQSANFCKKQVFSFGK
jgi:hypothetical protein